MTQTVCILGRQPALGLAELESLYGAKKLQPLGNVAALLDIDPSQIDFTRLGGTVKFAKLLTILDTTNWKDIQNFLEQSMPEHVGYLPEGKMKLGLSVYGIHVPVKQINATGLGLKKVIRATGRSVRVIPNTEPVLNSAQVLHNQLTGALGWELILIKDGARSIVAQNIAEQNIDAYAARDQARPKRDSKVGMLPPKLAQILINLGASLVDSADPAPGTGQNKGKTVLDPFCGTGVIMQEAALMGYDAYGTDLEQRMIDYSRANLDWLGEHFSHPPFTYWLDQADATSYEWKHPYDFIASEAYLGRPFSSQPSPNDLQEAIQNANTIIKKFLQNLAKQSKSGLRIALAVPTWNTPKGFRHLPLIDQISDLGYNRVSFVHIAEEDLVYHREGQIVARELLVLTRK